MKMMNGCCVKMSGPKIEPKAGEATINAVSAMSDGTLYSIPKRRKNIVDMVLKIIDGEGPKPMKNMRPAQKNRNGADHFCDEHHGEYENRCEPSRDRIGRVQTHNNACPKMYDELNKRRSIAKPTANAYMSYSNMPAATEFDPNCRICLNLKNQMEPLPRRRRPNKKPRQRRNKQTRNNRNRITKTKKPRRSAYPSREFKLSRIRTNKCCQCTTYYVPASAESKSVSTLDDHLVPQPNVMVPMTSTQGTNHEGPDAKGVNIPVQNKPSKKSDIDSGNPETNSNPSVSSYNSFMSMEHEPMVE
ncbi:hypothetical protein B5X24_HaOG209941 [Helicoverpa armigera]|uniref:Uncharacterized protein n=1 Tax=Helicoverpa armigera TaxID=29058 RepID=A0A2W1BDA1_HELAM|nr:hypothetical protein B5X24_HaOG209941 [Helicoverpa armigera]